jgi:hypothetical protein
MREERREAGVLAHVILVTLYVSLWTAESLFIHSVKGSDYEKASVTLAIEVFKLVLSACLYFGCVAFFFGATESNKERTIQETKVL